MKSTLISASKRVRVVLYLRQSKDQSGEGLAVDRQRTACEQLAADRGWDIVAVYIDNDKSASNRRKSRPDYDRMVADFSAGKFDAIICWDLDRLTRQPRQLEDWIDAAEERGLVIVTANGEADLSTDGGRMYARIKASVSRAEIERKSARQKARNVQDRVAGKPPARQAFGYSADGLSVDPVTGPAARGLFMGLLAGESISEMTRRLNHEGHRTTVRVGRDGKISGGGEWNRTNVLWLLKNPRYAAIRTMDVRDEQGARKVEVGEGNWPEIVSRDEFDAVQRVLSDEGRKSNRNGTARAWLGGGLYRCGLCGSDVVTAYREGGVRVYACRASGQAKHLTRVADHIDSLIERLVAKRLSEAENLVAMLVPEESAALGEMREEAKRLRLRSDQLAADYAEGLVNGRQLAVATKLIDDRLLVIDRALAGAARSMGIQNLLTAPDPGREFLISPLGVKREVIDSLCTITLLPGQPGNKPFNPRTVEVVWR